MKTTKLKKMIAREGLIIINIVLLFVICMYLASVQSTRLYESKTYGEICEVAEIISLKEPLEQVPSKGEKYKIDAILDPKGIYVMFTKETSKDLIIKTLKREYPNINSVECIFSKKTPYEVKIDKIFDIQGNLTFSELFYKINFEGIAMCVILAYPIYLIIRFIVWSSKTLKAKEETAE